MKSLAIVLLLTPLGFLGCTESPPMDARIVSNAQDQQVIDTWYVNTHLQGDVVAGVVAQRALYPHHFNPGSAQLTEIGQRDLAILADYYKSAPSALVVMRGDASDELYAARIAAAKDVLQRAGVDMTRVTVGEGTPGGRGISGQAIVDAKKHDTGQFSGTSMDPGSTTPGGTTSGETRGSSK